MPHPSKDLQRHIDEQSISAEFERRYQVLLHHCLRNMKSADENLIRRAFLWGHWAHRNDIRKNGEPYFYHPIEVATIVARDMRMDDVSVVAALLHDVVEDTDVNLEVISDAFGDEIAKLVDGLTKIDRQFENREIGRAENARKLLLSMVSDMRVIMVKFADRLHNMRTLDAMSEAKRLKIAGDTQDFFIPLAHRFGVYHIKSELEDLVLKTIDRTMFDKVAKGLAQTKKQREHYIEEFIKPIKEILSNTELPFDIKGRPKSIHSIAKKMRSQNKELHEIYDLFAIRIILEDTPASKYPPELFLEKAEAEFISQNTKSNEKRINKYDHNNRSAQEEKAFRKYMVERPKELATIKAEENTKAEIWKAYGMITDRYRPVPQRMRNFLSFPKDNGYQSLHTTVFGNGGKKVEIQIRSKQMDDIAERGIAAHWKYKESSGKQNVLDKLFEEVREQLEHAKGEDSKTLIQDFKSDWLKDKIQVFTPKGEVHELPQGATPIDFAFLIHTQLGLCCAGAKVNGRIVPLSTPLQMADQVEIIKASKKMVTSKWTRYAKTAKAKSAIKKWLDEKKRIIIDEGRQIWEKAAKKAKIEPEEQTFHRVVAKLRIINKQELLYQIGDGTLAVEEVVRTYRSLNIQEKDEKHKKDIFIEQKTVLPDQSGKPIVVIQGDPVNQMEVHFATCCNPIPGDQIFAFVSNARGMRVHKTSCKNAHDLFANHFDRVLNASWSSVSDQRFTVEVEIRGQDRMGLASEVTGLVYGSGINIKRLNIGEIDGAFKGNISLEVANVAQLDWLIEKLKNVDGVLEVYRIV